MLHEVQRQAIPELTRVFGHTGLYLRPTPALAPVLSGNMLANVVSLARGNGGFEGDLACRDDELPICSGCVSLVYGLFVLETSASPAALLEEVARVLKPEGVAILLTLNPWSPARLRWGFRGLSPPDPSSVVSDIRAAGLEVQRRRCIGPVWSSAPEVDLSDEPRDHSWTGLRLANMVVARRRDPGLTPLRASSPALKFRPGMSAG
ncbi:class I SAM-dependent methyltransferase [Arenimonas alkanexedens]